MRLDWVKMWTKTLSSSIMECSMASRYFHWASVMDSDSRGILIGTHECLSRKFNINVELVKVCLEELNQPDPRSELKDHEGRRIISIGENTYLVVGKKKYNPDPTGAQRQKAFRDRQKQAVEIPNGSDGVTDVTPVTMEPLRVTPEENRIEESRREEILTCSHNERGNPQDGGGYAQGDQVFPSKDEMTRVSIPEEPTNERE